MPTGLPFAYSALSAAPSIYELIKAGEQRRQADELAKIKNPVYNISEAYNTARTIARKNALLTRIPGYNAITGKIGASTANQIRSINETAGSGADAIAAGSAAVGQQQDALANLGIAGEQFWQQNQNTLMNAENFYGQQEEKKQQWDVLDPYLRAKQTEAALRNASNENTMGAIKGLTGAVSGGLFLANQEGLFNKGGASANQGIGTFFDTPKFGGLPTDNTIESGLTNEQKIQLFKMKNGRLPYSWEL